MEIGSEYNLKFEGLDYTDNNIFKYLEAYNTIFLNSGRSGFMLLDEILPPGEILMPGFICDCNCNSFKKHSVKFYGLDNCLNIDICSLEESISPNTVAIVVMNYFGHIQPKLIRERIFDLKLQKRFIVIEDTTHSIFSNILTVGDVAVCSLRKWFPIPDGGVIYARDSELLADYQILNQAVDIKKIYGMILKTLYLDLDNHLDYNAVYRDIFSNSEEGFNLQKEPLLISSISVMLLKMFDINRIISSRKNNFKYLSNKLLDFGIKPVCDINDSECPLSVPIFIENRDMLRNFFIENKIFCAVHWPIRNTILEKNEWAVEISDKIISLPIDHRYDYEHMDYIVNKFVEYRAK